MDRGFLAAAVLAAVTLAVYGTSARAINTALVVTARFLFLLFWQAYADGGLAVILGAPPSRDLSVFFVPPLLIVYLLVLFSLPALQQRLGRGL